MLTKTAAIMTLFILTGCQTGRQAETVQQTETAVLTETIPQSARFEAVIYEVAMPADRIDQLDGRRLAHEADLAQALGQLGEARALYSVDQHVNLSGDMLKIGASAPMTTGSRTTERGGSVNTVAYRDIGAIFSIKGHRTAADMMDMNINVELAALNGSAISISENSTAPIIRQIVMRYQGPMRPGEPIVLYSADAATGNGKEQAMVYITRLVLARP